MAFTIVCAECGITVRSYKSSTLYCSRACFGKGQTGNKHPGWKGGTKRCICAQCNVTYERPRTWHDKYSRHFCSARCRITFHQTHPELWYAWKGGITRLTRGVRISPEYKAWRKAVLLRDDYICQRCKKRGGQLHAHHLYGFAEFPHLRLSINNGHTLCRACHHAITTRETEYLISVGLNPLQPPLF